MLEPFLALPFPIVSRDVPAATDLVLVDHQAFQAYGTARVDLVRADTDFGAEAVAHAVRHPGRRVPENPGGVYAGHKLFGERSRGGQDRVRVVRTVNIDM